MGVSLRRLKVDMPWCNVQMDESKASQDTGRALELLAYSVGL